MAVHNAHSLTLISSYLLCGSRPRLMLVKREYLSSNGLNASAEVDGAYHRTITNLVQHTRGVEMRVARTLYWTTQLDSRSRDQLNRY